MRFIERVGELMVCMISSVGEQLILKYFFFSFQPKNMCFIYRILIRLTPSEQKQKLKGTYCTSLFYNLAD